MKTEYEVRVLEIDKDAIIKKLEELGATKENEYNQKRYVYDLLEKDDGKWIRLRTNGKKTTLTYKDVTSDKIDGTKECEVEVSDFESTNEILNRMGYFSKAYQENKRIRYYLDEVEIDIDSWPMIPTYIEIEGKNEEEVRNTVKKLEIDDSKVTSLDVQSVYEQVYGIDISKIKELKFYT